MLSYALIHDSVGDTKAAAAVLYPFDIVRQMTVAKGVSSFALSTIPFFSVYIGTYSIL